LLNIFSFHCKIEKLKKINLNIYTIYFVNFEYNNEKEKYFKKQWETKNIFLWNHFSMNLVEVSLACLHFSLMFSEGEVKSPCFSQVSNTHSTVLVVIKLSGVKCVFVSQSSSNENTLCTEYIFLIGYCYTLKT
jgi:hypothetical protein